MKNIIRLICLSYILSFATSCTDILEIKPTDFVSDELIWEDKKLLDQFAANIYGSMVSGFTRQTAGYGQDWSAGFGGNFDAGADDFDGKFDAAVSQFNTNSITASNCPFIDEIWGRSYSMIRKCNMMIENVPAMSDDVISVEDKAIYVAEFAFLRALCLFDLAKTFGRAPIVDWVQELDEDLLVAANSFDEIIKFVSDDCDTYAKDLPIVASSLGHATRGAFLALKAKALLYYASPLNNPSNETARWSAAAAAAKAVMDLNHYELYDVGSEPYYNLFFDESDANKEMIFARRYVYPTITHNIHMQWSNDTGSNGSWNGLYPTHNLADAYETTDGLPIDDAASIYDPQNPYANRDARMQQTLVCDGMMWEGIEMQIWTNTVDGSTGNSLPSAYKARCGYGLRKFIVDYQGSASDLYTGTYAQDNDWPIFRYAEVLLNYAEALNEAESSPSTEVYNAVNDVRARAGQPELPTGLSQSDMRERIHNERRVEMPLEEQRFWDLRRWKRADKLRETITGMTITTDGTTKNYAIVDIETREFSESLYYLPIPQSELEKNPSLVE